MCIDYTLYQTINESKEKYLETNENGNITYQNLWGTAKTFLRGKLIVINDYLKKRLKYKKKDKWRSKLVGGRKITKIRAEIEIKNP